MLSHRSCSFQGRSPSDNDDSDDETATAYSEDDPTPKRPPRLVGGPAPVHPAQRRGSMKQHRAQSERWDRRHSIDFSRRRDVGVIPETAVVADGSGGGGYDESDKAMWTWKEPPVLRKLDSTSSSLSYGRSRPASLSARGAGGGVSALSAATELDALPPLVSTLTSRRESEPRLRRAVTLEGVMGVGAASSEQLQRRRNEAGSEAGADFWDPLGLLTDVTSATPPAKKSVPARGSRRDMSLITGSGGGGGGAGGGGAPAAPAAAAAAASPSRGGRGRGGLGGTEGEDPAAAKVSSSSQHSLGSSRHSVKEVARPAEPKEISE